MTDSKENNNESSQNFADDLDAKLNDAKSSTDDQEETIDDEDAIDRLLMDDTFDVAEEDVAVDNVDQIIEQSMKKETFEEEDEFAEDEQIAPVIEEAMSANKEVDQEAENNVDELTDSDISDSKNEEDAFAEIDEFSDDIIEPEPEDDFLMADFDISANDEEGSILDDFAEEQSLSKAESSDSSDDLVEDVEDEPELVPEKTDMLAAVSSLPDVDIEKIKSEVEAITAQVGQLWTENETLTEKIDEFASLNEKNSTAEEIDSLQTELRKLRKFIKENDSKVPVISYVAIGLAVLALIVGGGLGAIGYGAESEITELTELVATLEEEIDILTAKDITAEIKKTNDKIVLLIAKDDSFNEQVEKIQSDQLKPVVDDLVKQNDHAQEAIELLLAKVETLEKRKSFTKAAKKSNNTVVKGIWVVNLVSFKQEWYAKRKVAEFEKKGIPAEAIQVNVNGENWFRLRVTGFKSKYEAAAYAVKVKKTLNLSSVWVNKLK